MSIPILKVPLTTSSCQPYIKQGNTISAITWDMGDTFDEDLQVLHIIRMVLKKGSQIVLDIDSSYKGGITITGARTFEINKIPENDLPCGISKGDLQIERYSDFAFDPVDVFTYANVEYYIEEQTTKRP